MASGVLLSGSSRLLPSFLCLPCIRHVPPLCCYSYDNRDRARVEVAMDGVGDMVEGSRTRDIRTTWHYTGP